MFNIESPHETFLASEANSVSPDVFQSVFQGHASVMVIGEINKGNPAFKDWSKRISLGEKLPRGKFFREQEKMRALINAPFPSVQYTSIHL